MCNHGSDVRYYHEVVGVNSRLDAMQAAILRIKLRKLDAYSAARNAVASTYDKAFADRRTSPHRPEAVTVTTSFTNTPCVLLGASGQSKAAPGSAHYSCDDLLPVSCHMQAAYKSTAFRKVPPGNQNNSRTKSLYP
ncbi:MAG: DegT/DnrJ/EryC1/StrS family aminotransferase [Flavobacteriales bacterium]|nr:DegT/DnrJ/EryC1/StrS family aminotransferase [Flavobacteriales bacterium]